MKTVSELAALVGGRVAGGGGDTPITGVASIADAGPGDITFFANPKYLASLKNCAASAVLVPDDFADELAAIRIHSANPSLAFSQIIAEFRPPPVKYEPGIHPLACVAPDAIISADASIQPFAVIESGATVGRGTVIGAHCYVGHRARVGEDCLFYPNVSVRENSVIGNRVILHSGVVIGSDGFGFEFSEGKQVKIPQVGFVQLDDDVEAGANTTIDRARFGRTWIKEGTKIDNLVQIGHNVVVGKHSIIVALTGISGSVKVGNYVTIAGQVGVAGHLEIADRAIIAAQSGVSKSVPPGSVLWGTPATPLQEQKVRLANIGRIGKLAARIKKLEESQGSTGNI